MTIPNHSPSLACMPNEIILRCLCSASTFWDVLHFAATCRRQRQIWTDNVNAIYQAVSPRAIQCRRYARILLADQGGAAADSQILTVHDVLQIVRNTVVMEKSVDQFNKKHVTRLTEPGMRPPPIDNKFFYGKPRPPYLIEPERIRFTRGLYQLWGLLILDPVARQQRMKSFKSKDIFTIMDLAKGFLDNDMIYDKTVMDKQKAEWALLETINMELYPFREYVINNVLGSSDSSRHAPLDMGYGGIISIWNNHYEDFKELTTWGDQGPVSPISEVWYDTSDEELLG